jgi:hypothetical protein
MAGSIPGQKRYTFGHLALTPGSRLGVYDIIDQIGEGGPPSLALELSELRRGLAVAQWGSTW